MRNRCEVRTSSVKAMERETPKHQTKHMFMGGHPFVIGRNTGVFVWFWGG